MTRLWKHILPLIAAVLFTSCSKHEVEVIPRSKMADIYMEMFMTDQWISSTPSMRVVADTSLVYEPILAKYGYDKLDYIYSVDYYMNDPERFARILRSCVDKLDKRIRHLNKLKRQQELEAEAARKFEQFLDSYKTDYEFDEYFPYLGDEPYVHYYDSLAFEPDSLLVYRLMPIETADTLYDRLEMIVRTDSLETPSLEKKEAVAGEIKEIKGIKTPGIKKPELKDSIFRKKLLNTDAIWQEKE